MVSQNEALCSTRLRATADAEGNIPDNRKTTVRYFSYAKFVFIFFILSALFSCAPPPSRTNYGVITQRPQPKVDFAVLEKQIHVLINNERRIRGLPLLAWDDSLKDIARKHSRDMSKRNYFDHVSPEGHDFRYRYQQGGYSCQVQVDNAIYLGAENIALNNLYDSITTVNGRVYHEWNSQEKIANTTVEGWMKSAGHRKNILTPYWRREGIGVIIAPDDKVYITQNFC